MIISHGRQYIFVHIPKTGGTSLSLALEARAMKDDILIGDTPKAKRRRRRLQGVKSSGRLWKHARVRDVYGLVDQAQIEAYFVFTMVRNPWDRMVSYYHWLREQGFEHPAVKLAKSSGFSTFLNHPATIASLSEDGNRSYVSDRDGTDRCDLYLRLEHLTGDISKLEAGIRIKLPPLQHVNRSERGGYRQYYTDRDSALIGEVFAEDVARFGYRFD
ncbi:MAG: sulfotransferase family protein [Rhodobacteraceae bacterium]|nr:sulfotransferase family protein [Paracoccaceae bacterium]